MHIAIAGNIGSGKTTLLGLLGGVQKPGRGCLKLLGQELAQMSSGARDRFRVDHTGYIFQQFNLLPFLSVRENVELPCRFSPSRARRAVERHGSVDKAAAQLLQHLGLKAELLERRADSLSIGQQQRVAAARALIGQPELVIADEPTANLDTTSSEAVIDIFRELHRQGQTIVMVTHSQHDAGFASRTINLFDGQVVTETLI